MTYMYAIIYCIFNSHFRSLNHPNLLGLLGTINHPHSVILVTNFVRGKTLHSLVFDSDHEVGSVLPLSNMYCGPYFLSSTSKKR